MTKTKWVLVLLAAMDLLLIAMALMNYFFLFLKPTGLLIPLIMHMVAFTVIGFRSPRIPRWLTILVLMIGVFFMLISSVMLLLTHYNYTTIKSQSHQSLTIEYRDFTLGETTYLYHFYKTNFGIIGKRLDDESIRMVFQSVNNPGFDPEAALGLDNAVWIGDHTVRFPTVEGTKEVHLKSSASSDSPEMTATDIEAFIQKVENKEDGHTITVNGYKLIVRYDESSDQSWIDVSSDDSEGLIPNQQCSRIVPNVEQGYYMLEECTHRWEYKLYPLEELP
ncbi:DUF4386 domain-containing protein [Pseudalkalibacillus hwajinpoensis]|uniref:DUF4386 domain-containing protein n=1 Tax=Guptibacillus hwajinpoensis TaxID=208199 RepID=UPI001CFD945E|nr:DUF4386 domain-containing protein [Pseudalkalibacillus hwajinpoensis]